ncbi:uncharacterized protein LOC130800709 [Amaranthus tricolor]|uniref:uncharacterized protein LOC130800709 n=1 Tax=Amaranthus tricolor TaxID=29722 RepID=UPI00258AC456|nr:uncharacterized protein LOC130800709 [Amaranthus tricolor]
MATAPVKSPLHNFPMTFLKWGSKKDGRYRRSPFDSPSQSSDSEPPANLNSKGSRSSRNRRNNINNTNNKNNSPEKTHDHEQKDDKDSSKKPVEGEVDVGEEKGWNLRPRKGVTSGNTNNHGIVLVENGDNNVSKSMRLRGGLDIKDVNGGNGSEKREKKKFWIALSREEIEEDVYSMTGSKPSRRPRKRPKIVQKQLDNVFPGLWLVGISPEAYRSLDVPPKR